MSSIDNTIDTLIAKQEADHDPARHYDKADQEELQAPVPSESTRNQIASDVEKFLSSGGAVCKLLPTDSRFNEREEEQKGWNMTEFGYSLMRGGRDDE